MIPSPETPPPGGSLKSADERCSLAGYFLAPGEALVLCCQEYPGPQLLRMSIRYENLPFSPFEATIWFFLTFVGSDSLLCIMMNDSTFPHTVLASASLSCPFTVASFSRLPFSPLPRCHDRLAHTALGLLRLPPTLPFLVRVLELSPPRIIWILNARHRTTPCGWKGWLPLS